jgi:predicted TPR repeat methyltransferase
MESASSVPDPLSDALEALEQGRPSDAVAILKPLVEVGRGGALSRMTLARALAGVGEAAEALALARDVAQLHPDLADGALVMGECLLRAEQLPTAIAEFQRALRLDPGLDAARLKLGEAWLAAGEGARALDVLAELPPDMPGLAEKMKEAEAILARPRSDPGYVRHLFDQFSADYDERMLGQLLYRAPQILCALADLVLPGRAGMAVLDLGCGTGLSGAAFRARAARLDGIDLSPAMVAQARARGLYDALTVGDIEDVAVDEATYDLVLAADTVVYLGDLAPLMRVVTRALKRRGFFLFTAEAAEGDGFDLGPKRRWRHSQAYLRRVGEEHGFAVAGLLSCTPRMEANTPVAGFAVALANPV